MPTIAYFANQFPSPLEPYVGEEIQELRQRGATVIPCSARRSQTNLPHNLFSLRAETLYLQPLQLVLLVRAAWLCLRKASLLEDFLCRILLQGKESPGRRLRALLHTWLGAYFALQLEGRGVQHIHVHHGYFGSWIAMVAAQLLEIPYTMTLHGSDLLLHGAYLDLKLQHCQVCITVSEFNRGYILQHYSGIAPGKVVVRRMGVGCGTLDPLIPPIKHRDSCLTMLAVGRLHPVKDHAFLLSACRLLKNDGTEFRCLIAGEGPLRPSLEQMILEFGLQGEVRLLGHVPHEHLDRYYESADLLVLTSRSEGIPLVMVEAMARNRLVLAPSVTGIPELVLDGETGFLYCPESLEDFVARVEWIHRNLETLDPVRRAARQHVGQHFSRESNQAAFCDLLLSGLTSLHKSVSSPESPVRGTVYENPVLQ